MNKSPVRQPSFEEVIAAFEAIPKVDQSHLRSSERIQVVIPGEMTTKDGRTIHIRLRDLSSSGVGFFHYGPVEVAEVTLKLAITTYRVELKWCMQCQGDLYMSGGRILRNQPPSTQSNPPTQPQPAQSRRY